MKFKALRVLYMFILAAGLFIMISPFPEGTMILCFFLSLFGVQFGGIGLWGGVITYAVTFPITLILIRKLDLVGRFKRELKVLENCRKEDRGMELSYVRAFTAADIRRGSNRILNIDAQDRDIIVQTPSQKETDPSGILLLEAKQSRNRVLIERD